MYLTLLIPIVVPSTINFYAFKENITFLSTSFLKYTAYGHFKTKIKKATFTLIKRKSKAVGKHIRS